MTLYLHIGLHKTGTSSLQEFLRRNTEAMAAAGYAYPKAGWVRGAHHNVAYQLQFKGPYRPEAGSLEDCIAEAIQAPNAIVSSEEFEFLSVSQVQTLKDALGDTPTRVVVYLRRQDSIIPSSYAQQARMGARMPPLADYATAALYQPRFDFLQILGRWIHVFGHDNIEVAVVHAGNSGPLLFGDFLRRVGLDGAEDRFVKLNQPFNPTPGWAYVELVRRVSATLRGKGPALAIEHLKEIGAAAMERVRATPSLKGAGRLGLDQAQWARVAGRFGDGNARVATDFALPAQDAAALSFDTAPEVWPTPPPEAEISAAAEDLAARFAAYSTAPRPEAAPA